MITVTKSYVDLPAAHRQHLHDGHCRQIHGHNWSFDITFGCAKLDTNGFVVDVGKLKPLKERMEKLFDHTLLINGDDPLLEMFKQQDAEGLVSLVIVPNCGMEKLAELVFIHAKVILQTHFIEDVNNRDLQVVEVVCWEDSKNRSTYHE